MSLLIRTPRPYPTESLIGYLVRLSEANGYRSPHDLFKIAGLRRGQGKTFQFDIDNLGKILGSNGEALKPIAYLSSTEAHQYKILEHPLGRTIERGTLRNSKLAFCVACVEELGYIDAYWDLGVAIACPKHHLRALTHCKECGKAVVWKRPGLLACACGSQFSSTDQKVADTPTAELMGIVMAKLHGAPMKAVANTSQFPVDSLGELRLVSLLRLVRQLGERGAQIYPSGKGGVMAPAAALLARWPLGFRNFLEDFRCRYPEISAATGGLPREISNFSNQMFKDATQNKLLRAEFIEFRDRHFVMKKPKSLDAPRREHDRSKARTRKFQVRTFAKTLGLPVAVLTSLRDMGVFPTRPIAGIRAWHEEDLRDFMKRGLRLGDYDEAKRESVSLGTVMRWKLRSRIQKADIVAALFDGRLTVVGRAGENLAGLLIDKAQLEQLVFEKRIVTEEGTYTFPQAAAKTGLSLKAVPGAIDAGLLKSVNVLGRLRVTISSVRAFNSKYLLLSKLAAELGTTSAYLKKLCGEAALALTHMRRLNNSAPQSVLPKAARAALLNRWNDAREIESAKRVNTEEVYVSALERYLKALADSGGRLPRFGGKPALATIAKVCGFGRHVLYKWPAAVALLRAFDCRERAELGSRIHPIPALKDYLKLLKESGQPTPRWKKDKPNMLAICRACGFSRTALITYPELRALVENHLLVEGHPTRPTSAAA